MGKQNATPEESAAEARKRQQIADERAAAVKKQREHDARVEAIRKEGEARRKEALEAAKRDKQQNG